MEIFVVITSEWDASSIKWVEARDAAEHTTICRKGPMTKWQ